MVYAKKQTFDKVKDSLGLISNIITLNEYLPGLEYQKPEGKKYNDIRRLISESLDVTEKTVDQIVEYSDTPEYKKRIKPSFWRKNVKVRNGFLYGLGASALILAALQISMPGYIKQSFKEAKDLKNYLFSDEKKSIDKDLLELESEVKKGGFTENIILYGLCQDAYNNASSIKGKNNALRRFAPSIQKAKEENKAKKLALEKLAGGEE